MKIENFPKEITEELAEETGWHIGDGSMNYYLSKGYKRGIYQLRGHMEDDRDHYIRRIKPIFKKLYGIDISLREMPSTRVFGFQIWSSALVGFKQKIGLPIGPKLNIGIPEIFLKDEKLKAAVIRGIFDTDGCVYLEKKNKSLYPRMQIGGISNKLLKQLFVAFNELGFRCSFSVSQKEIGNKKEAYQVIIRGDEMFEKFMNEIQPKNAKHIAKYNNYRKGYK